MTKHERRIAEKATQEIRQFVETQEVDAVLEYAGLPRDYFSRFECEAVPVGSATLDSQS